MSKEKIKDTRPHSPILVPQGLKKKIEDHFHYTRITIRKYIAGAALTPESQARAKKVREFALNYCNGVYMPNNK